MNTLRLSDPSNAAIAEIKIGTGSDAFARRVPSGFVRTVLTAPEGSVLAVETRRGWERRYIVERQGRYYTRTAPPKPSEVPSMPVGRGGRGGKRQGQKASGPIPVLPPREASERSGSASVLSLIAEEVEPPPSPAPVRLLSLVRDSEDGHKFWCLEAVESGIFSSDDAIRLIPLQNVPKNHWVLGLLRKQGVTVAQAQRLVR